MLTICRSAKYLMLRVFEGTLQGGTTIVEDERRDESRRGTQECVRHKESKVSLLRGLLAAERDDEMLEIAALHFQIVLVGQFGFLEADFVLADAQMQCLRRLPFGFAVDKERRAGRI